MASLSDSIRIRPPSSFFIIDELMMNQVESLPLTVGPYAREPGQVSPRVEKDGGPRYTKLEGTGVIPKWETECAWPAT